TDGEKEIAAQRRLLGVTHRALRHRLPEAHCRRLDEASARAIRRDTAGPVEAFANPVEFIAPLAFEAGGVGRVAVQLDYRIVRNAGILMQVVDVLRDQARRLAGVVQQRQRAMAAPWPRLCKVVLHRKTPAPGLVA